MKKIIAMVLAATFVFTSAGSVFASDIENEYVPEEGIAEYSETESLEETDEILAEDYDAPVEEQPTEEQSAEENGDTADTVNETGIEITEIETNSIQEGSTDEAETTIASYEAIEQILGETTQDTVDDSDNIYVIKDVKVTVRKDICRGTHCTMDGAVCKYTDYNYIDEDTRLYNLEYTVSYTENDEDLIFTGSSEDIFQKFGEYPSLTYLGTVKNTGKLTVCESLLGVEYSFIVLIVNHDVVVDPAVEATCTSTGLTEGAHCSICGTIVSKQEELPMSEHTIVTDEAVEPTMTNTGLTEGSHCSVCNTIITKQKVLPALSENGWHYIEDNWYYYKDGIIVTGWLYDSDDNNWFYLSSGGIMQTGWQYIDNNWYYFGAGGRMWSGGWKYIDNDWYYLGAGGKVQTGWKYINDYWYYFGAGGRMWSGGWKYIDNDWYYLGAGGKVQTGWQYINGYWYYFGAGGRMKTGWQYINDKWYYFYDWGGMLSGTGIVKIDDEYWYFDNDALKYITDLVTVDGVTYAVTNGKASSDEIDVVEMYASKRLDEVGWDIKSAYNWAASIPYENDAYAYTTTSGAAIHSFISEIGDCVGKAAAFYWMARLLGYDVKLIYGRVPLRAGGYVEHGWVEIVYDGSTYVCDPEFEWETQKNGYMINYGQSNTWRYVIDYTMADK